MAVASSSSEMVMSNILCSKHQASSQRPQKSVIPADGSSGFGASGRMPDGRYHTVNDAQRYNGCTSTDPRASDRRHRHHRSVATGASRWSIAVVIAESALRIPLFCGSGACSQPDLVTGRVQRGSRRCSKLELRA